jgi:class 3 adenylate cyclase
VDCGGCGTPNREDAAFCANCGDPLRRRCAACARELAADARFCDGCGAPQEEARPAPAAARKTVTAMFCDLGGSTGFGERVDAESARAVIGRYHAMLQEVVDAHAGTVAKFIGDGMLAFFGIPEVAEDDAERAVAAAAEMQARFGAFATEVADRHGEALTFRVGVNSGEVVIGDGDADVVGDALNVAARLEKACEPGRVLVGETTWRLTRGAYAFEPVGELTVNGRAGPVAAYALATEAAPEAIATPFVGRDDELGRLRAAFDAAVATRSARFVTIIGPPGVGKTRLSRELDGVLAGEAAVLTTTCERSGGATYTPIVDLLRPRLEGADADDATSRDQLAALVPPDEADRDRIVDGLAGMVGIADTRSTEETFWSVRRLVESLAQAQPVVIVVDDIQWAASLFLDLLEHLAEWVSGAPVLLVGLARPELRELRPSLAEAGRRVSDVLALDGLDTEATALLASRMLGGDGLPTALQDRLPESTGGNPLFVRELVRMLVDEGTIRREGDEWRLTVDADAVEVPPTIRSLLASRIERLPADERTVLERASILGADFTLGGLRALVDADDPSVLLERLRRRDLVEPTGAYLGDEPLHRFHHVLIRDAVYGRLLKETRAELHERAGAYTEAATADVVGEHEPAIAHHYEQAHGYLEQLGALDDHGRALGRRAAELLAIAASRALDRDDLVSTGALARRALACLDDTDPDTRAELALLGCEALLASGELAPAADLVDELAAMGADQPRLAAWGDAYRAQLIDLTDPDRLDEAEALVIAAVERFVDLDDQAGAAKAHLVHAGLMARQGRVAESETELDRALGAAREASDQRRLVAVLGEASAAALWGPSPVARAGGRCLDVIRLLRITAASPVVEATSTRHQAVLEALRGRFDAGRSLLATARTTVEDLGLRRDLMEVELFAGIIELLAGEPVAAEAPLRAAHEGLEQMGAGADAALAAAHLARALLAQGQLEDAAAAALASEHAAGQGLKTGIAWRSVKAEVLAATGEPGAVTLAEEAVALAGNTDLVLDHADAWAALATVRRATGDEVGATEALGRAEQLYAAKGSTVHRREVTASTEIAASAAVVERPTDAPDDVARPAHVENLASRQARLVNQTWVREGAEAIRDLIAEHCTWVDTRQGFSGVNEGRDAVLENIRAVKDVIGDEDFRVFEVIAERGDGLSLIRQGIDGDVQVELLTVTEYDEEGRNTWALFLDADALPEALAALDERHWTTEERRRSTSAARQEPPENLAARQGRAFIATWMSDGAEALRAHLAEGVRYEDRRTGLGDELDGVDAVVANLRAAHLLLGDEMSFDVFEVIAQRGDRLALFHQGVRGAFEVAMVSVIEFDPDGRQCFVAHHDVDALAAALDELEQRFIDGEGREHAAVLEDHHRGSVWVATGAEEELGATLAEDVVVVDHRPVGWGTLDRSTFLAAMAARSDIFGNGVMVRPVLLRVDARGVLAPYEIRARSADGLETVSNGIVLTLLRDRQTVRMEIFPYAAVAEAEVRFDELTADVGGLTNLAVRQLRRSTELVTAGDIDATSEIMLDDFVTDDRRRMLQQVSTGRDAALTAARVLHETLHGATWRVPEVLAIRGETVALARYETAGLFTVDSYVVAECDADGRGKRQVIVDVDDLADAVDLMEAWYAEGEGAEHAADLALFAAMDRATGVGDVDTLAPLVSEDFVITDHRRGIGGRADRETFLTLVGIRPDTFGHGVFFCPRIFRLAPGLRLASFEVRSTSSDGVDAVVVALTLDQVRDGQFVWGECWDEDDLDAALDRFDQLANAEVDPWPANLAARTLAEGGPGSDEIWGGSGTECHRELLAARGRFLALARLRLDEDEWLSVVEVDVDGLVRVDRFDADDLLGALDEVDDRFLAGEGASDPGIVRVLQRYRRYFADRAWSRSSEVASDDLRAVDHRHLRHSGTQLSDRVEMDKALAEQMPDAVRYERYVRSVGRVGLTLSLVSSGSVDGSTREKAAIGVMVLDDGGKITDLELFEEADLARAVSRYEAVLRAQGLAPT